MDKTQGKVYLVGAGCGGAEWMTLRGLRLLQSCQAVVYDDLIDQALLDELPETAERHYMGKRCGRHAAPQEEISAFLIQKAQEGKTVVRLKGGDPFVFGRGGEEMLALQGAGIPCEEVPGISSAIAIPAAAGIPVTHRGLSQSLHLVTGHTADTEDGLPAEFDDLAKLPGTLVILMGLGRLGRIAERLMGAGKSPETPAAVVSGGNAPHPAAVRGTLADIAERAKGMQPPAVIVVGPVAALELASTIGRPLLGVRVGLTGTAAIREKLGPALGELGAVVETVQSARVEELRPDFEWESLCGPEKGWLVFTSSNGVRAFFHRLAEARMDLRRLFAKRFAVIGAATGETLAGYGVYADLCPGVYTSAGLGEALCRAMEPGEEALLLRSAQGSQELTDLLEQGGKPYRDIPLYTLRGEDGTRAEGAEPLDYLVFASAGGVEQYWKTVGAPAEETVCVCIGEVTARAMEKRGYSAYLLAEEISAAGIAAAILKHCEET